ncbi:MAG: Crp/Fnr family transcriptional regulator [Siculibacillus sp.]
MSTPIESLAGIPLLRSLPPEEIRRLDRACTWRRYGPSESIVEPEGEGPRVEFVVAGGVRVMLHSPERDVIFTDIPAGGFFGDMSVIDGAPRVASVTALYTTLVAALPGPLFLDTVLHHPEVARRLLEVMTSRLRTAIDRVVELSLLDVGHRIRSELIRLARVHADDPRRATLSPPPIQAVIAARTGTRREAVSRELNRMERAGQLERRRGAWTLTDRLALIEEIRRAAGD